MVGNQNFSKKNFVEDKFTVLDLFAGCGGFSSGFKKAGFEIVAANEFWEPAQRTYARNHKKTKLVKGDIRNPQVKEELLKSIGDKKINVIIGGPPCQAFSTAGKRDPLDPRAKLYIDYIEILKKVEPDCFVMENVKGILTAKNEEGNNILELILNEMHLLGYETEKKVYKASEYELPQKRERVIIIGFKDDKMKELFEEPAKCKKHKTVSDAIGDLIGKKEHYLPNHDFSVHQPKFIEKIKNTPVGKSIYHTFADAYFRCPPNEPSRTVKENHGSVFLHYKENRVMTPRELARLQTFDDKFVFEGSKKDVLIQIGNAVPPLLAKIIAKSIKKTLIKYKELENIQIETKTKEELLV